MKILVRKTGPRPLYREESCDVWVWSRSQAIEYFYAYGERLNAL